MTETTRKSGPHSPDVSPLSVHWMFDIVLRLGGHQNFIQGASFTDDGIAKELGLGGSPASDLDEALDFLRPSDGRGRRESPRSDKQSSVLETMDREWTLFQQCYPAPQFPDQLESNLLRLSEMIGLDMIDKQIMGLAVMLHTDGLLEEATDLLQVTRMNKALRAIGTLLNIPIDALRGRLSKSGTLVRSGLLEPSSSGMFGSLKSFLDISQPGLADALQYSHTSDLTLFRNAFRLAPPTGLDKESYSHIALDVDIAIPYLRAALNSKKPGVNILVYGPPGTGKSELPRMLANELDAALYEIACTDGDGDPIGRNGRLCALRLAMTVLLNPDTLLVFDEVEDLFNSRMFGMAAADFHKGWMNRMLEENPVPCFWVTNDIEALDHAFVRRFDLTIHLGSPPRGKREQILRLYGKGELDPRLVRDAAANDQVMPAMVSRATNVAAEIAEAAKAPGLDATVGHLLRSTLRALGMPVFREQGESGEQECFDPEIANMDEDLQEVVAGLGRHGGRLCFYGPAGTGKTAAAKWVADQLGQPFMARKLSDVLSPLHGQTEANLAKLFAQAESDQAVLLLDEIEGFLPNRRTANGGLQTTAANELLMQLESYSGIFVGTTGSFGRLDDAAARRFDLKVKFDFMLPRQVRVMFERHAAMLGINPNLDQFANDLDRLDCLTAGDFATVARRAKICPIPDASALYRALLKESSLKLDERARPIGFMH